MSCPTHACALLLLALGLVQGAVIACDPYNEAQQHHCGGSCRMFGASTSLTISLYGSGAHRRLLYRVAVRCPHPGSRGESAAAGAPLPLPICGGAALLQPLPPAVFADIYQLDNAAAVGQGPAVRLFGPVDVESIERYSQPTLLAIYGSNCSVAAGETAERCSEIVLEVPLHARYPDPREPWQQAGAGWALSAVAVAELQPPRVLVRCPIDGPGSDAWQEARVEAADGLGVAAILWEMPAGNLRHGPLMAIGTLAAMAVGALAVLAVLQLPVVATTCQRAPHKSHQQFHQ